MNVLFVSSGNKSVGPGVIVKNQGESLKSRGIILEYYTISGKGVVGYIINIPRLRKYLKQNSFDIIHAHYSLSGIVAALAGAKPLVVSLMGSDTYMKWPWKLLAQFSYRCLWQTTVVKSLKMKRMLQMKKAYVISNGVNVDKFKEIDTIFSMKKVNFNPNRKNIIFVANPARVEKNFSLAKKATNILNKDEFVLHPIFNIPNEKVVEYMNAANVMLLTSHWEGSVNVVKEAMACNLPIVSVDVGDVKENIYNVDGCYICSYDPEDIAEKIRLAAKFSKESGRTQGRQRLHELGLDSNTVAEKIIKLYKAKLV